ncbi:MAG: hypothetical protein WCW68_01575 [Methanothrix sp.]|jgi:hypothetical protein
MSLSIEQRLAVLAALPITVNDEEVLVFEDDGGGWHNDPTIESWISFSIMPGPRYLYNIRSQLSETWNAEDTQIDDERGQINQGTLNIYLCSTNKRTVQTYERELFEDIERERLGLSLDCEGVTTGPETALARPLGSYNDFRLKRRVYRTLLEVPILYKFSEIETGYPIKAIEIEPWMGCPPAEMEHLTLRAPMLLKADMLLATDTPLSLAASMFLAE